MYATKTVNLGEKGKMHIKEGAMTAAAKREGVSNSEYEKEHEHDSGLAGKRARLAETMKSWHHGG
jgi:hypothetical protein